MIIWPANNTAFPERKDFRKAVRKFADQHDLTYSLQGGAYVFADFYLVLTEQGKVIQSTDFKEIPEGRVINKKEGPVTPERAKKDKAKVIPTLALHDYSLALLDILKDLAPVSEEESFNPFYGFSIPDLMIEMEDLEKARNYILDITWKLGITPKAMRIRGTGDRPEFLLIE